MYERVIELQPDKPNFALPPVWVGQGGEALYLLRNVPTVATGAGVVFKPYGAVSGQYFAGDLNSETGDWHVYVSAAYTGTLGQGTYEVAYVVDTRSYWAGRGQLNIVASHLAGTVPVADLSAPDTRVRCADNGLWYRVQMRLVNGVPKLIYSTEGEPYVS